jgi:hypothetical protein
MKKITFAVLLIMSSTITYAKYRYLHVVNNTDAHMYFEFISNSQSMGVCPTKICDYSNKETSCTCDDTQKLKKRYIWTFLAHTDSTGTITQTGGNVQLIATTPTGPKIYPYISFTLPSFNKGKVYVRNMPAITSSDGESGEKNFIGSGFSIQIDYNDDGTLKYTQID